MAGHEFRQYCFEELPRASSYTVNEVLVNQVIEAHDTDITVPITTYSIPLPHTKLWDLQEHDRKLHLLHLRITKGHLANSGYFIDPSDDMLW